MSWFEDLTGFSETSPGQVRENITVDGDKLTSRVNGKEFVCGRLEIPTLGDLRQRVRASGSGGGNSRILVREIIADIRSLHTDKLNAGSLFQVASQFNLLEMIAPEVTPEHGVGIYERDLTQGPACAIAAGAGTIYRNYFAAVNGQYGQTANNQIDCLADIGKALGNSDNNLWIMQNGYAMASRNGLKQISERLRASSDNQLDELRKLLRIGIQWDTQVTADNSTHLVSQAYCSALPVAYSDHAPGDWEEFAKLILEASYEATICTAVLNYRNTGNNRVYLTLLGGGSFGNDIEWIIRAIERALLLYKDINLDVAIVSRGNSNPQVQNLVENFSG